MGFLDLHVAHRIATGLRIFATDAGKLLFNSCMDGLIPQDEIDRLYEALFPYEPGGAEKEDRPRGVKVAVRTSYRGFIDARLAPPTGTGDETEGTAHFPAIVVDLASETPTSSLGGRARRTRYDQVVELMIIAQTKGEVRALHVILQDMLIDSGPHFAALGYPGGIHPGPAGDIRPADGAMAGLAPNLINMVQRYQRWRGEIVRVTPNIFTDPLPAITGVSLHHVDAVGEGGLQGKANPVIPPDI